MSSQTYLDVTAEADELSSLKQCHLCIERKLNWIESLKTKKRKKERKKRTKEKKTKGKGSRADYDYSRTFLSAFVSAASTPKYVSGMFTLVAQFTSEMDLLPLDALLMACGVFRRIFLRCSRRRSRATPSYDAVHATLQRRPSPSRLPRIQRVVSPLLTTKWFAPFKHGISRHSLSVERRTRHRKAESLNSCRSGGKIFFSRENFPC